MHSILIAALWDCLQWGPWCTQAAVLAVLKYAPAPILTAPVLSSFGNGVAIIVGDLILQAIGGMKSARIAWRLVI